jgi:hypothetical protein
MPRLQDIERFKRDLSALSHEGEVLERWGEKPEPIPPPEVSAKPAQEAPAPSEAPAAAKAAPRRPKTPPAEEGLPPDFASLLDNMPVGGRKAPSDVDEELEALLGGVEEEGTAASSEMPDLSELGLDMPESGLVESDNVEAPSGALDEFNLPDFDSLGVEPSEAPSPRASPLETMTEEAIEEPAELGAKVSPAEELSFEESPAEPSFELPSEPAAAEEASEFQAESFSLPEDFEMPSGAGAETEEGAAEEFSIPEFNLVEDETAAAPEAGPEEVSEAAPEAEPEALSFETPVGVEEFGAESASEPGSAPADEEFSVPDLDAGLGTVLGAEPAAEPKPEEGLSLSEGPLGEGSLGVDAFDSFNFDESGPGFGASGTGSARDLDSEIASLSEEAAVADTFKLDQDWGDFGALGGSEAPPRQAPPRPARSKAATAKVPDEKFKEVSLSEAQVDRLQDGLLSFPLNLRVAIEDILANDRGTVAQQSKLVWAMVEGSSAEEIALLAGRVLKRHIPIPKGQEKRTGAALEAEKGTLSYAIVHTFLPLARIGLAVLAIAAAVGYLGWRFVYVPIASDALYREGYRMIADDRYPEAESDFAKATLMREFVPWYYRYAEAYAAKRQYILAEKKYSELVEAHPKERQGILEWAALEKEQLKYEEAVEVLKGAPRSAKGEAVRGMTGLLSWDYFNEAGLLLLGDVYLEWAEEAPAHYEDARRTYAFLLERYGDKDPYLERMLLYFIRTDRLSEVLPLKTHFLEDPKLGGLGAQVLAELGGYLLDKGMLPDVRSILLAAAKKGEALPEPHYQLARYFRSTGDQVEERSALDNAIRDFAALPGLGGRQSGMYIDSLIWRAQFLAQAKEWLGAERDYAAAAAEYEKALELRRVKVDGRYGQAYAGLADVAFWQRDDLPAALALYERAASNGYSNADTSYKRGDILYRTGRYAEALEQFFAAGAQGGKGPYLDYAFGSALLARNDLFSAEAYFRKTSAAMAETLSHMGEPFPQESPSQIEVLRLYMQAENNLGLVLYRSAARSGDARRRNLAMTSLTHAARLYDQLSQAPEALEGPEPRNLGLQNMNTLLATGKGESLVAYTEIAKEMQFPQQG